MVLLMGDPSVAATPVEECGEALVPAGAVFRMSPLKAAEEPYRGRIRLGLHDRLLAAQQLLPSGLRL